MSYEKKEPPTANISLARIAWSLKELVDLQKAKGDPDPRDQTNYAKKEEPVPADDLPF